MRVIVQRVSEAAVRVDGDLSGRIGAGLQISLVNDGPVTLAIDSRNPE